MSGDPSWRQSSGYGLADAIIQAQLQGLIPGAPGDELDMFKARAQAFLPPGFSTLFEDMYGAQFDLQATSAATFTTNSNVNPRASKEVINTSGAGGLYYRAMFNRNPATQVAITAGSMRLDTWYVGTGAFLNAAPTGNAQIGVIGLYNTTLAFGATDAAGSQSHFLGIDMAVSTTNMIVRDWDGTTLRTVITSIPIEVGVYRRWEMCNDGMGRIYVLRDGTITDTITDLLFLTNVPDVSATTALYNRALGGTTAYVWDWFGSCVGRV